MMYNKEVRDLLTRKFDKSDSVKLPQFLDAYLKGERKLDEQLVSMLSFWLSHLEAKLYKTSRVNSPNSYTKKLDRVLLFLQYAQENKHKDGALLMSSYRHLFPYADLYLKLKEKRIAVGADEMSITKLIQCPELKHIRVLLTIKSQLENNNDKTTTGNIVACWENYITQRTGKAPGKLARRNFLQRIEKHAAVFAGCSSLERAWQPLSSNSVATY